MFIFDDENRLNVIREQGVAFSQHSIMYGLMKKYQWNYMDAYKVFKNTELSFKEISDELILLNYLNVERQTTDVVWILQDKSLQDKFLNILNSNIVLKLMG